MFVIGSQCVLSYIYYKPQVAHFLQQYDTKHKYRPNTKIASLGLGAPLLRPSRDLGCPPEGSQTLICVGIMTITVSVLSILVLMFAEPSATLRV